MARMSTRGVVAVFSLLMTVLIPAGSGWSGEKAGGKKPAPAKPAPAKPGPGKAPAAKEAEVTPLTDEDFQKTIASGVHVVYFWATWCGPCRMQGPIIEQVAKKYAGKVKVHKMDVDSEDYTATKYEVGEVPTSIVFKDGKGIIKLVGVSQVDEFAEELDPLIEDAPQKAAPKK